MQFTVYRSRGRNAAFPFVIDVTSDIIGEINRRIVIPLTPIERFSRIRPPEPLNPDPAAGRRATGSLAHDA